MTIRSATAADLSAITRLESGSPTGAHWTPEQYARMLSASRDDPPWRLVLVLEDELEENHSLESKAGGEERTSEQRSEHSEPVAFLVAHLTGTECELENIVVAPRVRRQGLGTRLLRDLVARAQDLGVRTLFLEVRESNRSARAFYKQQNFKETGRRPRYYSRPEEDAILCSLTLS